MIGYKAFKKAIVDSTNRQVDDKLIRLMFNNWTCTDPQKKQGWKTIGVSNHWHDKLKKIMDSIGEVESVPSSGGFRKAEEVKFNYSNLHLFANEQNAIARSADYKSR